MLALSDGLSLRISRLSLTRSSELKEEEDKMVKSSGETGCPVSQWCDRMLVGGLARFLPVSAEMPKCSDIRVGEKPTRLGDIQRAASLTLKTVKNTKSLGPENPVLKDNKVRQSERRTENKAEVNVRKSPSFSPIRLKGPQSISSKGFTWKVNVISVACFQLLTFM